MLEGLIKWAPSDTGLDPHRFVEHVGARANSENRGFGSLVHKQSTGVLGHGFWKLINLR